MHKKYLEHFNVIAAEKLPPSLYEQLAPHLAGLLTEFLDAEQVYAENDCQEARKLEHRMRELRDQFEEQTRPDWVKFARQHWPDVDKYVDLERQSGDDIPF